MLLRILTLLCLGAFAACSLEAPQQHGEVKIFLEETQHYFALSALDLESFLLAPSSTSSFNCFAVNVTGAGLAPVIRIPGECSTTNNWKQTGPGVQSPPTPRGTSIDLDPPSGKERTIDVYGLDPTPPACGGTNTGDTYGYHLGRAVRDLLESATVTIPIAFTSGASVDVTCKAPNAPPADGGGGSSPPPLIVVTGAEHGCALKNGSVKCWGRGDAGRLGYGDTSNRGDNAGEMGTNLPFVDLGSSGAAQAKFLAAGLAFNCAILTTGLVKCWGAGNGGQLGQGDSNSRGDNAGEMGDNLPTVPLGTGRTAKALTAGERPTRAPSSTTTPSNAGATAARASSARAVTAASATTPASWATTWRPSRSARAAA
jgi:hypothetical protein